MAFIERLPGPMPAWYAVTVIAAFLLITLARLLGGYPAFGGNFGYRLFSAFMIAFPAYLAHDLTLVAGRALSEFREALRNPAEEAFLRSRLTTTPALPSLLFSLGGAVMGLVIVQTAPQVGLSMEDVFGPARATAVFGAGSWFINSQFSYRVIHQMVWVGRIYGRHTRVDLNHLKATAALTRLSGRSATASILVVSGYGLGFALTGDSRAAIDVLIPNFMLVLVVFLLPLLGAHRLLEGERDRRLREIGAGASRAMAALEAAVADGRYADVPPIKDAYHALDLERTRVAHIPTWPWAPGTLRGVLATGFLPILIWLIQFGLTRLLS
jgi:hypothetical protein